MKYRIVETSTGFALQERRSFCWLYLRNAWGVPPAFKTAEEAERALRAYMSAGDIRVVKEIEA